MRAVILFTISMVIAVVGFSYFLASVECWMNWSGTSTNWRMSKGTCQVETDKGWIPQRQYRVAEVT